MLRNGKPLRVEGRKLGAADVLDVLPGEGDVVTAEAPEAFPEISIVYRDGWLIAVDKPSGVLSQPAATRRPDDSAMDELLLKHLAAESGKPPYLRLVHRIDRVTSGLLLFAAHPGALSPLDRAWREGAVERSYLAVVEGSADFESREVDAPIGRCDGGAWRFRVSGAGRPARTELERLATGEADGTSYSVLQCRLLTGRTHQVRVHLSRLGLPVLGDTLYGASRSRAPRPLLHAAELRLPHPETGRPLVLEAPAPEDFQPFLSALAGPPAVE